MMVKSLGGIGSADLDGRLRIKAHVKPTPYTNRGVKHVADPCVSDTLLVMLLT